MPTYYCCSWGFDWLFYLFTVFLGSTLSMYLLLILICLNYAFFLSSPMFIWCCFLNGISCNFYMVTHLVISLSCIKMGYILGFSTLYKCCFLYFLSLSSISRLYYLLPLLLSYFSILTLNLYPNFSLLSIQPILAYLSKGTANNYFSIYQAQ